MESGRSLNHLPHEEASRDPAARISAGHCEMVLSGADEEVPEWIWPTGAGAVFVLGKQRELVNLLADRVPVFLDVNFWVAARQALTGESDAPELIGLLGALRMAAGSGRMFFPVTADLIVEFSKQRPDDLAATMMLVDWLSLGVALVPHQERMVIEVENLMARSWPAHPPVARPIWTSFAFAFGYEDLRPPGVDIDVATSLKLTEIAWQAPPTLLASQLDSQLFAAKAESERIAAYLNEQAAIHAEEIDRRETAVRIELEGASSMITGIAALEARRIAQAVKQPVPDGLDWSASTGRSIARLIARGLKRESNQRLLGSLYVPAMLHAAVRSEAGRRMKPNDVFDFRHAAAALPYCRAFFTDGPLRSLITSGHMRLDKLYGCKVAATPSEALAVLESIQMSPAA